MTKKEIVRTISEEIGLTQLQTKEIVQRTFDAIVDTLVQDTKAKLRQGGKGPLGRIELRNFGVFEVKRRAPRMARNPRTSAPVEVAAKYVVTFKPGKEMEERVSRLARQAEEDARAGQSEPAQDHSSLGPVPETLGTATSYSGRGGEA